MHPDPAALITASYAALLTLGGLTTRVAPLGDARAWVVDTATGTIWLDDSLDTEDDILAAAADALTALGHGATVVRTDDGRADWSTPALAVGDGVVPPAAASAPAAEPGRHLRLVRDDDAG